MAPLALVHGNPETAAVWDHLAPSLEAAGRDPVRLSPPGFGAPVPPSFRVTPAGYRDWLVGELERFGEPASSVSRRDSTLGSGESGRRWRATWPLVRS